MNKEIMIIGDLIHCISLRSQLFQIVRGIEVPEDSREDGFEDLDWVL